MQLNPTLKEITTLIAQLSEADQTALLKALRAQVLLLQPRLYQLKYLTTKIQFGH